MRWWFEKKFSTKEFLFTIQDLIPVPNHGITFQMFFAYYEQNPSLSMEEYYAQFPEVSENQIRIWKTRAERILGSDVSRFAKIQLQPQLRDTELLTKLEEKHNHINDYELKGWVETRIPDENGNYIAWLPLSIGDRGMKYIIEEHMFKKTEFQTIYKIQDPTQAMQFILMTIRDDRPAGGEIDGGIIRLRYKSDGRLPDLIVELGRFDHHIHDAYPDPSLTPPEPRTTNYIPLQFQLDAEFRDDALRGQLESIHDAKDSRYLTNLGWVETKGITDENGNNIAWIPDHVPETGGGYKIVDKHGADFKARYPTYGLDTEREILQFILETIRDNEPAGEVPADPGRIAYRYHVADSPFDLIVVYGRDDHHIHSAYPDT